MSTQDTVSWAASAAFVHVAGSWTSYGARARVSTVRTETGAGDQRTPDHCSCWSDTCGLDGAGPGTCGPDDAVPSSNANSPIPAA